MTFGLRRVEPLRAEVNGAVLAVLAASSAIEAISRLVIPPDVAAVRARRRARRDAVNVAAVACCAERTARPEHRGQLPAHPHRPLRLHRHGDRRPRDPRNRLRPRRRDRVTGGRGADAPLRLALLRDCGRIFLEAAPEGIAPRRSASRWPPTRAWSRCTTSTLGARLRLPDPDRARPRRLGRRLSCCRAGLEQMLHERFGIAHTTLQVEHEPETFLKIEHGLD